MIRTLIADDDALLRAALRTMVDWEALGYTLVWDCTNGLQVLELLQRTTVDLLITDMKMPLLDGLGLIRRLRQSALLPVTVVLSGYDEYQLVQEAFRLGAHDYLLKGNLDTASLTAMLTELRRRIFADGGTAAAPAAGPRLAPGSYGVAVFAVDDMARQSDRFGGDLKNRLDKPMLELVRQIPRVAGRATLRAAGPGQYELLWQVRDKARYHNTMLSVVQQIQAVWRDYMNLSVSAAVSDLVTEAGVADACALCGVMVRLAVLQGPGAVCTQSRYEPLARACLDRAPVCAPLVNALGAQRDEDYEAEKEAFFRTREPLDGPAQTQLMLVLLTQITEARHKCGLDAENTAGCEAVVQALGTPLGAQCLAAQPAVQGAGTAAAPQPQPDPGPHPPGPDLSGGQLHRPQPDLKGRGRPGRPEREVPEHPVHPPVRLHLYQLPEQPAAALCPGTAGPHRPEDL